MDPDSTAGLEAFCRIAPAIPVIADVITSSNLFDVLTNSTGGRLPFAVYEKYLGGLDRLTSLVPNSHDVIICSCAVCLEFIAVNTLLIILFGKRAFIIFSF